MGENFSDMLPILNGLTRSYFAAIVFPPCFRITNYKCRRKQSRIESEWTDQPLVYADGVNLVVDIINTITKTRKLYLMLIRGMFWKPTQRILSTIKPKLSNLNRTKGQ
jgi:hypothetical protein